MTPARRRLHPPLAVQIVGLMLGGLVVAQAVTLGLTVLLPPRPPPQYRMADIAAALQGRVAAGRAARRLVRTERNQPPSLRSVGWLVSERSRHELAALLGAPEGDVRLLFYSPGPFAGAVGLADLGPEGQGAGDEGMDGRIVSVAMPVTTPPGAGPFAQGSRPSVPPPFAGGVLPGGPLAAPRGAPGQGGRSTDPDGSTGAGRTRANATPPTDVSPGGLLNVPPGGWLAPDAAARATQASSAAAVPNASPSGRGVLLIGPGGSSASVIAEAALSASAGSPLALVSGAARPAGFSPPLGATRAAMQPFFLPRLGPNPPVDPPILLAGRASDMGEGSPRSRPPAAAEGRAVVIGATSPARTLEVQPAPTPALAREPANLAADLGLIAPAVSVAARTGDTGGWVVAPPETSARGLFGLAPAPFVEGDFVAAERVGQDDWITVQPAPEPFPNTWQRRVLLWFAISFALVAPAGFLFARRLVAPLTAFAGAAERLGRDPSGPVLALDGPAEIGRAALAFTLMQQRLKRYIDDRTAMVGAISHDLRTPLARMRFRLERAPPELKPGLLGDVSQMEEMISSVLVFIRDASEPAVRERVDLRSIIECVVDDAALVGGDAGLEPGAAASVEVDPLGVQRVVTNLVENALKYGRSARLRLYTETGEAVTEVADEGPGLSDEDLERVFLPFYRSAPARTLNAGGIGLGLAVSRSIARAHGGDVRLMRGGHGLIAQLRLPLAHAADPQRLARPHPARTASPTVMAAE